MKCSNCGRDNAKEADFCAYCGSKIDSKKSKKKKLPIIVILCLVLTAAIGTGLFFILKKPDNNKLVEEGLNDYFEINSSIKEVEAEFVDSDGYINSEFRSNAVEAVGEYAEELLNDGKIEEYDVTADTSVWIKFKSGMEYVYVPSEKDCDSASVSTYQPCLLTYNKDIQEYSKMCVDNSAQNIEDNLSDYLFNNNYDNDAITLDTLKNIGDDQVVIWHGHGGYNNHIHSFLGTQVAFDEKAFLADPESYAKKIKYTDDYLNGRIICTSSGSAAVTVKFFEHYLSSTKNSIIYLGTCHSGTDDVLANAFISKGAKAVVANTSTTCTVYDIEMIKSVFSELLNGNTTEKKYYDLKTALDNAKIENGPFCCDTHKSEVFIYGDNATRLTTEELPFSDFKSATYIIESHGSIIATKNDGIYYKSNIEAEPRKIVNAKYVKNMLSDGETVYYVEEGMTTTGLLTYDPQKIYKVNIKDGKSDFLLNSDGAAYPATYRNGYLYYFDVTEKNDSIYQVSLIKYDFNAKSGAKVFNEVCTGRISFLFGNEVYCLGNNLFFTMDNTLYSFNLLTEKYEKLIKGGDRAFFDAISEKICFRYYKNDNQYIALVDANNNIETSVPISGKYVFQKVDYYGKYALFFDELGSSVFDLYRIDLKTGEIQISSGDAGAYKNKNYFSTRDLAHPENIYFMYSVGLYDESTNKIVHLKYDKFDIDINKSMYIVNNYILDSDLNIYKIYLENKTTLSNEEPSPQVKTCEFSHNKYAVEQNGIVYYADSRGLWKCDKNLNSTLLNECKAMNVATDGQTILYSAYNKDTTAYCEDFGKEMTWKQYDMYLYDLDTSQNTKILSFVECGMPICKYNNKIFYTDLHDDYTGNSVGLSGSLFSFDLSTGKKEFISDGAWSTRLSGTTIYYKALNAAEGTSAVYSYNMESGKIVQLSDEETTGYYIKGNSMFYTKRTYLTETDSDGRSNTKVGLEVYKKDLITGSDTLVSDQTDKNNVNLQYIDEQYLYYSHEAEDACFNHRVNLQTGDDVLIEYKASNSANLRPFNERMPYVYKTDKGAIYYGFSDCDFYQVNDDNSYATPISGSYTSKRLISIINDKVFITNDNDYYDFILEIRSLY
ncbi:MAG: hypothetical protein PUC88_04790 [Clostridia bacterium]|nr:hypothetical protein [Clostridia bacterium]